MIPVQATTTAAGYAELRWVQQLQKTTRGARAYRLVFVGSALLGAGLGYYFDGHGGMVVLGAMFMTAAGTSLYSKVIADPSEKLWRESAVTRASAGRAWIAPAADGALEFFWEIEDIDGNVFGDHVPLDSFDAFEKCRMDEYFTGPADQAVYGQCLGILLHAKGIGPKCVAVHDGPVIDIAALFQKLTLAFIVSRPSGPPRGAAARPAALPAHSGPVDPDEGKPATL